MGLWGYMELYGTIWDLPIFLMLADFWFSPPAAPHAMAKRRVQGKTKHVQMALNIKSAASASADGLQKCYFEGFNDGAGGQGRHRCVYIIIHR